MHLDLLLSTQLNIEPASVPVIFRIGFVFFLVLVMLWMKDEDRKNVTRIND
jgi:hypothetical protein